MITAKPASYIGSVETHTKAFVANSRMAVQTALKYPAFYLDCPCCRQIECTSEQQPDTGILYRLILQSGHQINLADLFLAYQTVLSSEVAADSAMDRFYRGLAELRLLGDIVAQGRKDRRAAASLERLCTTDSLIQ